MSDIVRALGQSVTCVVGGKSYTFSPWTKRLQGAYEDWLEAEAFRAASRRRRELGEEAYAGLLAAINADVAAGKYSLREKVAQRRLRTPSGVAHLLWLLLAEKQPELTEADVLELVEQHTEDVSAALERLLGKQTAGTTGNQSDPA